MEEELQRTSDAVTRAGLLLEELVAHTSADHVAAQSASISELDAGALALRQRVESLRARLVSFTSGADRRQRLRLETAGALESLQRRLEVLEERAQPTDDASAAQQPHNKRLCLLSLMPDVLRGAQVTCGRD